MTFRTFAFNKPIWQKHVFNGVIKLFNGFSGNFAVSFKFSINSLRQFFVFRRIGRVIVIELHQKLCKISAMFFVHLINQGFWGNTLFFGAQHNRRTMRIIRTHIMHGMALHFLKTHPNIGLYVFDQMAEMDAAVSIR